MVVGHLVLPAHDVAQRLDGGLIVRLLQLVHVGRFAAVGIVPALHHGLDEHRHDDVLRLAVLDQRDGRVGLAPVVVVEGIVKVVEESFRRHLLLVREGTVTEHNRVPVEVAGFQDGVATGGGLEGALVGHLHEEGGRLFLLLVVIAVAQDERLAVGQVALGLGQRGLASAVVLLDASEVTERAGVLSLTIRQQITVLLLALLLMPEAVPATADDVEGSHKRHGVEAAGPGLPLRLLRGGRERHEGERQQEGEEGGGIDMRSEQH